MLDPHPPLHWRQKKYLDYLSYSKGGSKWRVGTRETEVGLDRWCEGGLGQQRDDGGCCASMRDRSERVESPGTYVTE